MTIRRVGALLLAAIAFAPTSSALEIRPHPLAIPQASDNVVLLWDEAILEGIRATRPGPTITARALAVVHSAMFDAWAAYDTVAVPSRPIRNWRRPEFEGTPDNKQKAISFAAYRTLVDLFPGQQSSFDATMASLGYDPSETLLDTSTAAGVGNVAAAATMEFRHHDGSNQKGDLAPGAYSDWTGYQPVNTPAQINDINRWQPLNVLSGGQTVTQVYTTPHWDRVIPFAMTSADQFRPTVGPATHPSEAFTRQAQDIVDLSANLDDYQKTVAEYWADGPGSEFPPGHWALFGQFVSRRDGNTLDEDVKMFFAIGNALHDAAICAWDAKRRWDSVRPITAIRFLFRDTPIRAWGGPGVGTITINGSSWAPYQIPGQPTPPFPEFTSGHSTYSAAAAEVLRQFTGSAHFGYSVVIPAGASPTEPGFVPAQDLPLSFPTFTEAAASAGWSRRWGGIHFEDGDLAARASGSLVGEQAWEKAASYFDGTASSGKGTASRSRGQLRVVETRP